MQPARPDPQRSGILPPLPPPTDEDLARMRAARVANVVWSLVALRGRARSHRDRVDRLIRSGRWTGEPS